MTLKNLDIQKVVEAQRSFAKERNWDQFHTPKNLSTALMCEAAELAEIFQWLTPDQSKKIMRDPLKAEAIKDEIGDVLYYLIRLADKLRIDPSDCFWGKIVKSAKKYPIKLSHGRATKYTDFKKSKSNKRTYK